MRAIASLILLVALVAAGCLSGPRPAAVTPAVAHTAAPAWSKVARVFDVPKGDSFGLVRVDLTRDDQGNFLGAPIYGVALGTLGESAPIYADLTVYKIEGNRLVWGASSSTVRLDGHGALAGGADDGAPPSLLAVATFHAGAPLKVRMAAWTSEPVSFPADEQPGHWLAHGGAEVSFFLSALTNPTAPGAYSYGVDKSMAGVLADGVAQAGALALSTSHKTPGPHLDTSQSVLFGGSGAGLATVGWTAEGNTKEQRIPWVSSSAIFSPAGQVVVGSFTGPTGARLEQLGGAALPFVFVTHLTLAVDIAELNFTLDPRVDPIGLVMPHASSSGLCSAAPVAHCRVDRGILGS